MKNFFYVFALALMAVLPVSCLKSGSSNMSYTLDGSFEYLTVYPYEGLFKDSTYSAAAVAMDSYSYLVSNYKNEVFNGGWTLSRKAGQTNSIGEMTPFSSAGSDAGAKKSLVYAVYYENQNPSLNAKYDIVFDFSTATSFSCILKGMYIDNSGAVIKFIKDGNLKPGDYMKVVVNAYCNDVAVGTAEKYLVDYRTSELKYISDWEAFTFDNITATANEVKFDIVSNRTDIPMYFCMDDFYANVGMNY